MNYGILTANRSGAGIRVAPTTDSTGTLVLTVGRGTNLGTDGYISGGSVNGNTRWWIVGDSLYVSDTMVSFKANPVGTAPAPVPPPAPTGHAYGIAQNDIQYESNTVQQTYMQDIRSLGFTWLRVDANWSYVTSSWANLDQVIMNATTYGLTVDLIINGTPSDAKRTTSDYGNFAKSVATRYLKTVSTFEIWNEQNLDGSWGGSASPASYTPYLKAAYTAIKSVNPSATVLLGGTAPAASPDVDPRDFLKGVYAYGGKGYFDAVAHHPYVFPAMIADNNSYSAWGQMYRTTPSLRSIMTDNGDSSKQIWLTEFGAPTGGGAEALTEAQQAEQLAEAITTVRTLSWAGPLFLYTYKDIVNDGGMESYFGLVNHNNIRKPSYASVQAAIKTS